MHISYQLDYQRAPWHTFRYKIKNEDGILYQIRRTGFRKYRQFEDGNNRILYYIGVTTIKSTENEGILAEMHTDGKSIDTIIGQFTITDLDISQRIYTLKLKDEIIAQVIRNERLTNRQSTIEIQAGNEQQQAFIFALLILIDIVLESLTNPMIYSQSFHAPLFIEHHSFTPSR